MPARSLITLLVLTLLPGAAPSAQNGSPKTEKLNGYAEWRRGDIVIVDGQRVRVTGTTKFKGKNIRSIGDVPLGYEVNAKGARLSDGALQAVELEAKPNGQAFLEADVKQATDEIEQTWLRAGEMYEPKDDGGKEVIGKTVDEGLRVDRVRSIMHRLRPPYVPDNALRVHVVETKDWNAAAMGNGAIWVYSGLIDEMTDDELAIVLGHELAHYTHEHSRRAAKSGIWTQLLAVGAVAAAEAIDNDAARVSAQLGALLAVTAFGSNYSRDQEDQADRVGLRYAYEAGFDVAEGPRLWGRFREKYGNGDKVTNFLFGGHSRPSDRIRNIRRELAINYPDKLR